MNKHRYNIEDLLDDDLFAELTEHAFGKRCGRTRRMSGGRKAAGILAACACAAFVLVLANFDSVLAAARTFVTYFVGDAVERDAVIPMRYEVLESPVAFADGEGYWVDMAYRKNNSLYFNISVRNQEENIKDTLKVEMDGMTFQCVQAGGYTVSSIDKETEDKTTRTEIGYMLEDAPAGNTMTLRLGEYSAVITLSASPEYAADTVRKADLGWLEVEFIPLSQDCRVLGYITRTEDRVLKDAYFFFPYGEMRDQKGNAVKAGYIGGEDSFSHELTAEDEGTAITGFSASKVGYRLGGFYDSNLGEYRFTVPERGESVTVNKEIEISGIAMHLKTIDRSAEDEITFTFAEETNRGWLSGMTLGCEWEENTGHTASSGEVFTAGISWSRYETDLNGNTRFVTSFPYETGEEMAIIFRKIEGEMKGDIQVQWAETQ